MWLLQTISRDTERAALKDTRQVEGLIVVPILSLPLTCLVTLVRLIAYWTNSWQHMLTGEPIERIMVCKSRGLRILGKKTRLEMHHGTNSAVYSWLLWVILCRETLTTPRIYQKKKIDEDFAATSRNDDPYVKNICWKWEVWSTMTFDVGLVYTHT